MTPTIAITPGEPAGIGPDIVLHAAMGAYDARLVAIADAGLLRERAQQLQLPLTLLPIRPGDDVPVHRPGSLAVIDTALANPVTPGRLDPGNAAYVLATLDTAIDGCVAGRFDALVTGPVQKSVINEGGVSFSGHTEYLAERTGTPRVVMMLAAGDLRVALATTHLPLREVADAVTPSLLEETLRIVDRDLRARFNLAAPRIAVLGLNPHAGESGHLGREEIDTIIPALERLRQEGLVLEGPLPADTAFNPPRLAHCDAVFAMYHDQGLPVLKHAGFGRAVNITLGLPIVRTSVDHGTALDLAATGRAEHASLGHALDCAIAMARA